MNVLFYTSYEPVPSHGGVEKVTYRVAEGLKQFYGYKSFCLYKNKAGNLPEGIFVDSQQLPLEDLHTFINLYVKENSIDIIVIQGRYEMIDTFRGAANGAKILYVHHSDPSYEYDTFNLGYSLYKIKYSSLKNKIHYCRHVIFYPIYKYIFRHHLRKDLLKIYKSTDKMALISQPAIKKYISFAGLNDSADISYINNPLSFDTFANKEDLQNKKKQVLIVARMEERTKKLTKALRIWKLLSNNEKISDWKLVIVGDGVDLNNYKEIVKKQNIQRIEFVGAAESYKYFCESSLFFMTSISEAWGMTLTEAMQTGCVPIAFDSYAAIRDIIDSDKTGIIVKYGDLKTYASCAMSLMLDKEKRNQIAMNAVESSRRFEISQICHRWKGLIDNTINE